MAPTPSADPSPADLAEQDARQRLLLDALADPRRWPPEFLPIQRIETHISRLILAGPWVYKIKKPVNFGFLDFSTLDRRRHCCLEEVRLNRRLAPALEPELVALTGAVDRDAISSERWHLSIGTEPTGPVLEYAVRMRRFPPGQLLAENPQRLDGDLMESLADRIARFHAEAAPAPADGPYGTPASVLHPMRENFDHIHELDHHPADLARLDRLQVWTERQAELLASRLERRRNDGWIRECHGDLHLGNITLMDGQPLLFDGIEFNPALSHIDTLSDLAFLLMDLDEKGLPHLARRLLNRYLEQTGDYQGLPLLRFYLVYRAMVRAKVAALRLAQPGLDHTASHRLRREFAAYLELAGCYTHPGRPGLLLMHGVSGSGKSHAAMAIVHRLPAIRVRSDVVRRQIEEAQQRDAISSRDGISGPALPARYGPEMTRLTYARLRECARAILQAGLVTVIDATFLLRGQRQPFRALAAELGVPYALLSLQAPPETLRQRIRQRLADGTDPSEADVAVLEGQLQDMEPLAPEEQASALIVTPERPLDIGRLEAWLTPPDCR